VKDLILTIQWNLEPSEYDVVLTDVKHNDVIGPIAQMGVKYLEHHKDFSQNVIKGILYGTHCRPMINLVVSSKRFKKPVNVIFLVDTGSPCLYVCQTAMDALGFSNPVPQTFDLIFRGKAHEAVVSPLKGHYHDINLIGATFLSKTCATLDIDYGTNSVKITFESSLYLLVTCFSKIPPNTVRGTIVNWYFQLIIGSEIRRILSFLQGTQ
jgi:hypothetical protein